MRTRADLRRVAGAFCALALAAVLATGCGGSEPTHARAVRYAYARSLFREICAGCHKLADAGAYGRRADLDDRTRVAQLRSAEFVRYVIQSGDDPMPEWRLALSQTEIKALTRYIVRVGSGRTHASGDGRRATTLTPRATLKPDPDAIRYGRAIFRESCAGCHTLADAGAQGQRFDLDAALAAVPQARRKAFVREALSSGQGMPNWSLHLRAEEQAALAAYLSTVAVGG